MHSLRIACRIVLNLLSLICILVCLGALGVIMWLWLSKTGLQTSLGEQWFNADNASLNLTQAITQRYLHPALWEKVAIPLLDLPSWKGLGVVGGVCFLASAVFAQVASWLGRRGRQRY